MRYYIFTLGCQMNISDSQRIAAVLESCGLKSASEKEADLVVVNACSVRQSAVDRIYGKLKNWQGKKVILTGCILPFDKKKLETKVDLILNITDLPNLPKFLEQLTHKSIHIPKERNICDRIENYLQIPSQNPAQSSSAFVPIMTGCDNFCTYCAVPYTRGREISRPEKEIIDEVKKLVKQGVKEIILLGQNVNSYNLKSKAQTKTPFVSLLEKLVKIPGNFKIKFLTSNPWDFSNALIDLMAKESKISKELHLPVQSGDDAILRKMNRKYTAKQYLNLVEDLRLKIPNLYLSTDLIVGFPGETKRAFDNTVKLCKKAKFNKAYIAMYSPRPGTAAFKLYKDDVPLEEKRRRWKVLNEMINKNKQ